MKKIANNAWLLSTIILFTATGCNKENDNVLTPIVTPPIVLPPIGGYNSSNEVGDTSLIAYWPFDGSYSETKANLSGANTGASFTAGIKGQGYQGSKSTTSYVIYSDPGIALPALKSFTTSFWINASQPIADQGTITPGLGGQGILDIVNSGFFWANLHINLEPFHSVGSGTSPNTDTLLMKVQLSNYWWGFSASSSASRIINVFLPASVDKWTHIAITYDGSSGRLTFYENGVITGNNSVATEYGPFNGTTTLYAMDPGSANNINNAPIFNVLNFKNVTSLVIGSWQISTTPSLTSEGNAKAWATHYTGGLDEMRIWKKALNDKEINSLYLLEKAKR